MKINPHFLDKTDQFDGMSLCSRRPQQRRCLVNPFALTLTRIDLLTCDLGTFHSFLSAADAKQQQLAYVESSGNAIIKVDNKTVVPYNEKRNTIRIASKDSYGVGSVWIADMLHMPFGVGFCSCFFS